MKASALFALENARCYRDVNFISTTLENQKDYQPKREKFILRSCCCRRPCEAAEILLPYRFTVCNVYKRIKSESKKSNCNNIIFHFISSNCFCSALSHYLLFDYCEDLDERLDCKVLASMRRSLVETI